jgi:D-beta-D-heptose 7-phosphate kinase/D-beta-D-heptose 1-phosphate adenosyltransferase
MGLIVNNRNELLEIRNTARDEGKKVVFTNGCFDILHAGHVDYLSKAKALGDILIVAINSDSSVRRIKGDSRPVTSEKERLLVVSSLLFVDYVTIFDEDTPFEIINFLIPDVLVKGADWSVENIVGRDIVEKNGGVVKNIKFEIEQSTSHIINKILNKHRN